MFRGKKNWNIKGYLMKKLINKGYKNSCFPDGKSST